ncbi:MAG: hypothetical protein WC852_07365 [Candidatus Nanoarchaeia archaeon]|jgi:hypothetical protein
MASKLLYAESSTVTIGRNVWIAIYVTWPFNRIEVYKDQIALSYLSYKRTFKKNEITLQKIGRFFRKGIRIIHHNPHISPYIEYWPVSADKLYAVLKSAGYKIK